MKTTFTDETEKPFATTCAWIWHPELEAGEPGYVTFERRFLLARAGELQIRYSADHRAVLRLNGKVIARGPGKSDLEHYYCETMALPLTAGEYVLRAEVVVWRNNYRKSPGPWSQIGIGGGFLVAGSVKDAVGMTLVNLDTPGAWQCRREPGRRHRSWIAAWDTDATIPTPPMEECDLTQSAAPWLAPQILGVPYWRSKVDCDNVTPWLLIERPIPALRESEAPIQAILWCNNSAARLQLDERGRLHGTLPAGRTEVLLDLGEYRTAFAHLSWREMAGTCEVAWSEALFTNGAKVKRYESGARVGRAGYADKVIFPAAGGSWDTFHFRCGRWAELRFALTAPGELTEFSLADWHYPFEQRGVLELPPESAEAKIAAACWRTILACAHETYEDCPYYEQQQYVGDTRIQARLSYILTGDDRLARQAIDHFAWSLTAEGLIQSRYPCNKRQLIPQFSLYWLLMLADHYQYYGDITLFLRHRRAAERLLDYFEDLRQSDGLIGAAGFWNVTDWVEGWPVGKIDRGSGKPETLLALIYAHCCTKMAELLAVAADETAAEYYRERARRTLAAVNASCYDTATGFFRDVPGESWYSCHTNVWAVLAGAVVAEEASEMARRILEQAGKLLAPPTLYFSFYMLEMLRLTGLQAGFAPLLMNWQKLLDLGFDTFPETPELGTRSDCHAWSSAPLGEFITTVLGVTPEKAGFALIKVAPTPLFGLNPLRGEAPLGAGEYLSVAYEATADGEILTLDCSRNGNYHILWPGGAEEYLKLPRGKNVRRKR